MTKGKIGVQGIDRGKNEILYLKRLCVVDFE